MSWVAKEFNRAELKDERLNNRLVSMMENFAKKPSCTILESSGTWAECMAAYRFFANEKVTPAGVMSSHIAATKVRVAQFPVVLVAHDTTSLNYSGHEETEGLGAIGDSKSGDIGLQMHTSYVLSDEGLSLGILHQEIWSRKESQFKKAKKRVQAPIELKESSKWIKGIESASSILKDLKTRVIHLCDREGDIYEVFCSAQKHCADFIIRCKSNRRINKKSRGSEDGDLLQDALLESKV